MLLEQLFLEQLLLEHNLGPKSHKSQARRIAFRKKHQTTSGKEGNIHNQVNSIVVKYIFISYFDALS